MELDNAPWRETHQVYVDVVCVRNKRASFAPNSLRDHLKDIGGVYEDLRKLYDVSF